MRRLHSLLALDRALLLRVQAMHAPIPTMLMRGFTRLGNTESWTLATLLLLAAGGESFRTGALIGTAAVIATIFTQVLKRTWRRPRPEAGIVGFTALTELPDAFSFPSGHTAAAFAVAIAVVGHGHGLDGVCLVLASLIGLSRIYLGAHYPLDVAVGATLGSLAGLVARLVLFTAP